jgi:hypothetical protein
MGSTDFTHLPPWNGWPSPQGHGSAHSGGNDRFCARLKTDISAFSSGLQGHLRSCHFTILDSSRRPLSKNVRHDLVRPRRPELEAEMSVVNLAQKRSFPPLCAVCTFLDSIIRVNYSTAPPSWKDNTNFQRLSFVYWNQKYWASGAHVCSQIKQDWKSFQSLPASIILVYCIGFNMG